MTLVEFQHAYSLLELYLVRGYRDVLAPLLFNHHLLPYLLSTYPS